MASPRGRLWPTLLVTVGGVSFALGLTSTLLTDPEGVGKAFQWITTFLLPLVALYVAVVLSYRASEERIAEDADQIQASLDGLKKQLGGALVNPLYILKLVRDPNSTILEQYIPFFLNDLDERVEELSRGHVWESDPTRFHRFVKLVFGFAREGEHIIATSAVHPGTFWRTVESLDYLDYHRTLQKRGVCVWRFFFVKDGEKENYLDVIGACLNRGVRVGVVVIDKVPDGVDLDKLRQDGGIVGVDVGDDGTISGGRIAINCVLDRERKETIWKVDAWIGHEDKIQETRDWLSCVKGLAEPVETVYGMTEDEIRAKHGVVGIDVLATSATSATPPDATK